MGYSTRRKSLNLSDMGIIAPKRSRTASHPSPPETVIEGDEPTAKRSKQSHSSTSPPPALPGLQHTLVVRAHDTKPLPAAELSPPPSPPIAGSNKVDVEGINDDVVIATIQQLERTGNRPHLVRELASIMSTSLPAIERSANPTALVSSRLTAYLNRPWPTISPCPLTKEVSAVHPRRLHFFLTTMPVLPINDVEPSLPRPNRIISPSLSSASADDETEDVYLKDRRALSPSPEVDLSSPELDNAAEHPNMPGSSFPSTDSLTRDHIQTYAHNRRAASPLLENEERDFKQTASALHEQAQARRNSPPDVNMNMGLVQDDDHDADSITMSIEGDERDSEESTARRNHEAAISLFESAEHILRAQLPPSSSRPAIDFSSPVIAPRDDGIIFFPTSVFGNVKPHVGSDGVAHPPSWAPLHLASPLQKPHVPAPIHTGGAADLTQVWDNLVSPECIELDELENMFDAY